MEQKLFEIMKRASVFVILAQTMLHFCPRESYEKYLRLLVSLMTVTVLVFPLLELLQSGITGQFELELNKYEIQMEQLMEKVQTCDILDESDYLSTISDEIKKRLNKISSKTGYVVKSVEIQGIERNGEENWNQEKTLKILAESESESISTISVDKIKCSGNTDKSSRTDQEQQIVSELCQMYASELGMRVEDLEVVINEVEK